MEEDLDWWNINYDQRYDILEDNLEKKGSILDIGSGTGYFLKRGVDRGWDCTGFEPSKIASQYSRQTLGLNVINDFFNEESVRDIGLFDAIHMSQVLEHIPNPKELLHNSWAKLRENGILCISVPNDYNPFQLILRDSMGYPAWWESPPHHLNYFNMESLKKLMIDCRFKPIKSTVTFPIDIFLIMGKNYIDDDDLGRKCHNMRMEFEKQLHKAGKINLKNNLYDSFSELGIGRELIVFGRKISA